MENTRQGRREKEQKTKINTEKSSGGRPSGEDIHQLGYQSQKQKNNETLSSVIALLTIPTTNLLIVSAKESTLRYRHWQPQYKSSAISSIVENEVLSQIREQLWCSKSALLSQTMTSLIMFSMSRYPHKYNCVSMDELVEGELRIQAWSRLDYNCHLTGQKLVLHIRR